MTYQSSYNITHAYQYAPRFTAHTAAAVIAGCNPNASNVYDNPMYRVFSDSIDFAMENGSLPFTVAQEEDGYGRPDEVRYIISEDLFRWLRGQRLPDCLFRAMLADDPDLGRPGTPRPPTIEPAVPPLVEAHPSPSSPELDLVRATWERWWMDNDANCHAGGTIVKWLVDGYTLHGAPVSKTQAEAIQAAIRPLWAKDARAGGSARKNGGVGVTQGLV